MKRPEVKDRFVNPDAELPYGTTPKHVTNAIQEVCDYWHEVNEWHLKNDYGRFYQQFRANNAIGGFLGHRFILEFAEEMDSLEANQMDDGYPDLLHTGGEYEWPSLAVKDKEGEGPGLEVKSSQDTTFYAHHNVEEWLIGIHYQINAEDETPADVAPIEFTQVLCASMDHDDWVYRDADGSNRTNTSDLPKEGMHELRKNPVYEMESGLVQGNNADWNRQYRQNHARFDPVYREENPAVLPDEDGSNVCDNCGQIFKNARGVTMHQGGSEDCGD